MNAAKLHMNWRGVMRNAKAEELRGAVSALAQRFERAIDRRDLLIQACAPPAGRCLHARACTPPSRHARSPAERSPGPAQLQRFAACDLAGPCLPPV